MKKAVLVTLASVCLISLVACKMDNGELKPGLSPTEKRSHDARRRTCSLPDGSQFSLTADAPHLGKHDVFHSGRIRDAFADAFHVKYEGKNFTTRLMSFNDGLPDCGDYGLMENTLYVLTDQATLRFMTADGKRGSSVLVVSGDGGHSFSDNIHPNANDKDGGNQQMHAVFKKFGYYKSRFRVLGGQYQLEITDPDFNQFLLFVSSDGGKAWTGHAVSVDPTVYSRKEVDYQRAFFATNRWYNKKFKATAAACSQRPEDGCARATSDYWDAQWNACLRERSAPACLKSLPDPTPRFADGEPGI